MASHARPKKKDTKDIKIDISALEELLSQAQERDYSEISLEQYRVHYICGEIDEISGKDACEFLLKSFFMDPKLPVKLIINSQGGDVVHGFAIIDLMTSLGLKVETLAVGEICSMGFLIFVAGTKGERVIAPNCAIMSHQFYAENEGKLHELKAAYKEFQNVEERIINHLMKHTGLPKKKVLEYLLPSNDVWLTPEQALQLGVGDRILPTN